MFGSNKKQNRLGQWNGRSSSRGNVEAVLSRLKEKPVLLRLLCVVLGVVAATLLADSVREWLPYRIGQTLPTDFRARVDFGVVNQVRTDLERETAIRNLRLEGKDEPEMLARIREHTPAVVDHYPEGTPLVAHGQPISPQQLDQLQEEHRAYLRVQGMGGRIRRVTALLFVMGLLAVVVSLYVVRFQPALWRSLPKTAGLCALLVVAFALGLLLSQPPWYAGVIPLAFTALVITLVYGPQFALLLSFSLSLAMTVALELDLNYLLIQMGGLATGVMLLGSVRTRTRLVEVGVASGLAFMLMTLATGLLSGQTYGFILLDAGRHFAWGILAGFLVSGSLPLIERCFGVITDVRLLDLADGSHPLLQELLRRAPGTYTHSMTVATLSESAAEAIGANPLLARVGSYFHDIGKMLKPAYFIENQNGENRHDGLEPALSTLIIISHVKDGVALGEQYRLPPSVMDFIRQHHGTTLVEYFYREALRLHQSQHGDQETNSSSPALSQSSFRYPGPKPQNRENGIVMLADAAESSSRALSDPTPNSLRKLVHELRMKRLLDGQFDESGLTLTELQRIEESLVKSLIALYHARIKYPEGRERGIAS